MSIIDLRSDTVTKPSKEMRKAMFEAEVGDDVYKEDPTVNELEEYMKNLLGKEAALYVPSGVMGNQICLNIHTQPGDEVICDANAHILHYESGSLSALSGIQVNTIEGKYGIMTAEQVESIVRPNAYYMPQSKVIEIENTHNRAGGTIYNLTTIANIHAVAKKYNLKYHMDGARLWHASVATGVSMAEYVRLFDSVSVCLSKGLGAPIGSIIAGKKDFINSAIRVRKAWGGGMRQVGIIAAAGLYAVKNNVERLKDDHDKAKFFAEAMQEIEGITCDLEGVETNIVMFDTIMLAEEFAQKCEEKGVRLSAFDKHRVRVVFHMDVSLEDVKKAIKIIGEIK
ncbi:MAG: aminotransferase class I/II-fold pyridoxal phosphate-dependent enzyme [Bacteroidetes bacterium]|nr:aminotransferase class I/II-fold pyridoxal phosphate-dependent enzyme [Bacteroidota bacterium]